MERGVARPTRRAGGHHRLLIAAIVVLVLVVVVRLVLDPVAAYATRRGLSRMEGMRGDFASVHVTLVPLGYTITRLKLVDARDAASAPPVFYAEGVHVSVLGRRLLHRQLVARVRVVHPKITVVSRPTETAKKASARAPDLSDQLGQITPAEVERLEIMDGEVLFRDAGAPRSPELWLHHLELAAETFATRERLTHARPTTLSAKGVLGHSGDVRLFVSADPFASPLELAGRVELVGLRAAELYDFLEPKTELQAKRGTIDLYAEFQVKGGRISGGVRPVLKNIEIGPTGDGVWDRFKARLADTGVKLASDRVPGRNAVATTVPIEGTFANPDVQLWPAILGVVRNAFVEGITAGFARLPPPQAEKHEGVLTQARKALTKKEGPPKAQPSSGANPAKGRSK